MKKEEDRRLYNKNFWDACKNAGNGIVYGFKSQSNLQKDLIIAAFIIIISLLFHLTKWECVVLCFSIFFVIVTEMINTAIETAVDLYTNEFHPKAKLAKDVAAGAVVLSAVNAIIVAYFLFFDKIVAFIVSKF